MKSVLLLDTRYSEAFEKLSDEQLGILVRALMKYKQSGELPSIPDKVVDMAFNLIRKDIDSENERYKERCQRNRENAKKRWAKCSDHTRKTKESKNTSTFSKNEVSKQKNTSPVNYEAMLNYWNKRIKETNSKMPTITHIDNNRRRLISARIKEYGNTHRLQIAFEKAFVSSFLNGNNKDKWVANIDWILEAHNFSRVLDGNFNPPTSTNAELLPILKPLTEEELRKEHTDRIVYEEERKKATEDKQRVNIMLAIKAAEQNPHSARAKVAYIAYNDGTMARLGILWTPPTNTHNDTQPGNKQVAQ